MENFENKYKKKNPFTVPEGYFETFNEKLTLEIEGKNKPQKIKWRHLMTPYLGLVGFFVLALFIVQTILPGFINEDKMLVSRENGKISQTEELQLETEEFEFLYGFNPTDEEILEYLATEVNDYDLLYAVAY